MRLSGLRGSLRESRCTQRGPGLALAFLVLAPAATAQETSTLSDDFAAARVHYYEGRIDEAIAGFEGCLALGPGEIENWQRPTVLTSLAVALEVAGRRTDALQCMLLSRGRWSVDPLHRYLALDELSDLREDPRFGPVRKQLELAHTESGGYIRRTALAKRSALAAMAAAETRIRWRDGHTGVPTSLAFSPNGDRLVSLGADSALLLWSTWLAEPPRSIGIHNASGTRVEYSRDGEVILVVDFAPRTATLYDGLSGELVLDLVGDGDFLLDAALMADARVWTVALDGRLHAWDVRRGRKTASVEHPTPAQSVDAAQDGSSLLVLDAGGRAWLCDPETGERSAPVGEGGAPILGASFDPLGRVALVRDDGSLSLWNADGSGRAVLIPGKPGDRPPVFSQDGTRVVRGNDASGVSLWNALDGAPLAPIRAPNPKAVATGRTGIIALVSNLVGTFVSVWDAATGENLAWAETKTTIVAVACARDGRVALGTFDGIFIVDADGTGRSRISHASRLMNVSVSSQGRIASGLGSNTPILSEAGPWSPQLPRMFSSPARVWDLKTGRLIEALSVEGCVDAWPWFGPDGIELAIASPTGNVLVLGDGDRVRLELRSAKMARFSPDGSRIALTHPAVDSHASLLQRDGKEIVRIAGVGHAGNQQGACPAQFSPDGALLVVPLVGGGIYVADGQEGSRLTVLEGHGRVVNDLAFDPTSPRMVSASLDGTARVWELTWFESVAVLGPHPGPVISCAVSPDGRLVVTGCVDALVRVFDTSTGKPLRTLTGHSAVVRSLEFDPATGRLLSTANDGTARIWDVEQGPELAILRGHVGGVTFGEFLPDGRIVTGGEDATVRVWNGTTGALLATHVEYDEGGWLTFEPGGRYVAGGRAAEWARIEIRETSYPLSSYAALLEDPAAVELSLAGETMPAVTRLPTAPVVRTTTRATGSVETREVSLALTLEDQYGIEDVVVERDGEVWARGVDMAGLELEQGGRRGDLHLAVPFAEGAQEIQVRVRATNARDVKSAPVAFHRRHVPPAGSLYLVTIAVADYDDDRLDLASPRKDALAIAERMRLEAGGLYREVLVHALFDDEVTRENLYAELEGFVEETGPEDTVMVFVAGHGARTGRDRYFFLTPGATPESPTSGIERPLLEALVSSKGIEARRRVMFLDTCHAGEEIDTGNRGLGNEDSFLQEEIDASAGSGIFIVAGSTERGAARETAENGVFTRALLDGLDGEADGDGNRAVDIMELITYASRVVREAKGPQKVTTPTIAFGDPFPLARVR